MRLAMTRRMLVCGTSVKGMFPASATIFALGYVISAGAAGPRVIAASISALTMRPCGPLPARRDKSMVDLSARRRASGLTKTRRAKAPRGGSGTAGREIGAGAGLDAGVTAKAGAAAGAAAGMGADCAAGAADARFGGGGGARAI